jgi:hypothetical protein
MALAFIEKTFKRLKLFPLRSEADLKALGDSRVEHRRVRRAVSFVLVQE